MDFRLSLHTIYSIALISASIYIALIFWSVTNLESVEDESVKDKPIDYYLLAVQWPATRGKTGNENCRIFRGLSYFTIHGLWPQWRQPHPECNGTSFNIHELGKGLIKKMKLQWPSLEGDCNNERFWQHEWRRHGACSDFSSPSAYFNAALRLNDKSDFKRRLAEIKVTPGKIIYNFKKIFEAFDNVKMIICNKKNNLYEIRFCIAADASQYIPCQGQKKYRDCTEPNIGFPAVINMHDEL